MVVGPLEDDEGNPMGDLVRMAYILKTQYEGVFRVLNPQKFVDDPAAFFKQAATPTPKVTDINPRTDETIKAIDAIAVDSAAHPDGFNVQSLKTCKDELALPPKLIVTNSLATGTVPSSLKEGIVTSIHKGKNKRLTKNYRPVTLTSHTIKIIEQVVKRRLTEP